MVKINADDDAERFEDFRGEILRYNVHDSLFNVLYTKAGMLRSGDYHPNTQFNLLLSGEIELTLRIGDKDVVSIKKPNELIVIPPNTPHLYRYIKDTVMFEWWDGELKVSYFEPYRKLVMDSIRDNATKK